MDPLATHVSNMYQVRTQWRKGSLGKGCKDEIVKNICFGTVPVVKNVQSAVLCIY